jgi:hypothetical protein
MEINELKKEKRIHERRLAKIRQRIAMNGRSAEIADILEAEDIDHKISEIDKQVHRLENGLRNDVVLYTQEQVAVMINDAIGDYKEAVTKSFSRIFEMDTVMLDKLKQSIHIHIKEREGHNAYVFRIRLFATILLSVSLVASLVVFGIPSDIPTLVLYSVMILITIVAAIQVYQYYKSPY